MNKPIECFDMNRYLLVVARGRWTEDFAREVIDTARSRLTDLGYARVLLDLEELSRPDRDFIRYLSGKYIAEVMGSQVRIAAYGKADNITGYAETVAQNRGATLRAFSDRESALDWLLSGA